MKKVLFILIYIFLIQTEWDIVAQQDPQYTQYALNTMVVNPAFTGARGVPSISVLHRSQWIGLDGAPNTQTLSFSSPISRRVGLGLSVVNDEIGNGTSQETYFDGTFSYTIEISELGRLALGLKAGGHFLNLDFSKLINYGVEPNLVNVDNKFSPNFGIGAHYYTDRFYAGVSLPNILETEHFDGAGQSSSFIASERMNFYVISGYRFDINPNLKLNSGMLVKMVSGAPIQTDVSAGLVFNEKFSFGAAYRFDSAVSALFGLKLYDKLMVGLAYDVETTTLGNTTFNDGSFEVFLRFDFMNRFNRREVSNRFF